MGCKKTPLFMRAELFAIGKILFLQRSPSGGQVQGFVCDGLPRTSICKLHLAVMSRFKPNLFIVTIFDLEVQQVII
jgi:hypothetical protein